MPNRVGPLATSAGGAVDGAIMATVFGDNDSNHSSVQVCFGGDVRGSIDRRASDIYEDSKEEVGAKLCASSGRRRVGVWPS